MKKATGSWVLGAAGRGVVLAAGLWSANALATGFVYQFDNAFSGTAPTGPAPWVDATFQDTSGGVLLTVNGLGLQSSEFLDSLYLNINPADSSQIPNLKFTFENSTGGVAPANIQTGEDAFKADGDGKYDILFDFQTSNLSPGRLGAGDTITYLISGITGLSSSDFVFLSTPAGGNGPFDAAGHIQSIGTGGASGWVEPSMGAITQPTPEPGSTAILGLAVGLMGLGRWWLRRK